MNGQSTSAVLADQSAAELKRCIAAYQGLNIRQMCLPVVETIQDGRPKFHKIHFEDKPSYTQSDKSWPSTAAKTIPPRPREPFTYEAAAADHFLDSGFFQGAQWSGLLVRWSGAIQTTAPDTKKFTPRASDCIM